MDVWTDRDLQGESTAVVGRHCEAEGSRMGSWDEGSDRLAPWPQLLLADTVSGAVVCGIVSLIACLSCLAIGEAGQGPGSLLGQRPGEMGLLRDGAGPTLGRWRN